MCAADAQACQLSEKTEVLDVSVDARAQMRVRVWALSLGTYGMIVKSPR